MKRMYFFYLFNLFSRDFNNQLKINIMKYYLIYIRNGKQKSVIIESGSHSKLTDVIREQLDNDCTDVERFFSLKDGGYNVIMTEEDLF